MPHGSQLDGRGVLQGHEVDGLFFGHAKLLSCAFGYERNAKTAGDHGELADDRLSGVAGVRRKACCPATGNDLVVVVGRDGAGYPDPGRVGCQRQPFS